MRLVQFVDESGNPRLGLSSEGMVHAVRGVDRTYDAARLAIRRGLTVERLLLQALDGSIFSVEALEKAGCLQVPVSHPDAAHCLVTGTGLTHLGSAAARDAMHRSFSSDKSSTAVETDSMRMFRSGLEGGKPATGIGAQPEWFYKGDGSCIVPPGSPLPLPEFAKDGGEEPEIAGVYLIGDDGTPWRIGFALANEFSDHVMERENYLLLAHSKLRACSLGPELLLGELPAHIEGTSRVLRNGDVIWEETFLTGEQNMSHALSNLEYHHFKYDIFRRPGDLHIHFFGTATLSFTEGLRTEVGDVFEIEAVPFGSHLRNRLEKTTAPAKQTVRSL